MSTESTETLTADRVRDLFDLDHDGNLIWKHTKTKAPAGSVAGWTTCGRRRIGIDGKIYRLDAVVWLWHRGEWPVHHDLTHRNGDLLDCRIDNLVDMAPPSRKTCKTKDLPQGVSRTRYGTYVVKVIVGTFDDPLTAALHYAEAMRLTESVRVHHGVPVVNAHRISETHRGA